MRHLLRALNTSLASEPIVKAAAIVSDPYPLRARPALEAPLAQDDLWPAFGRWFRDGDFIIAETETSAFGIPVSPLSSVVGSYNQTVFGSIGFATGAAVGSFLAIKELNNYRRCILITGEGSLHLTVQAFMDILKLELNPIIFILNNNGYTIERMIHGKEAAYNTTPELDYSQLAHVFGPGHRSIYHGPISTYGQLEDLFNGDALQDETCLRVVELKLDYLDAPAYVRMVGEAVEQFNAKKKPEGGKILLDTGRSVPLSS